MIPTQPWQIINSHFTSIFYTHLCNLYTNPPTFLSIGYLALFPWG